MKVRPIWPRSTVFLLAAGPSLRDVDLDPLRDERTIAINRVGLDVAPWASALYFTDHRFWRWYRRKIVEFDGLIFTGSPPRFIDDPRITCLATSRARGLSLDPTELRHGNNSGYAAINLAVHLGAKRIVLLGYDMRAAEDGRLHCHEPHETEDGRTIVIHARVYDKMIPFFASLRQPLKDIGVEVLNATPDSAITCFPNVALADVSP